ncbi:hypothetical protein [Eggerthella sinensis]|uniref:hypothetical protein n=1 Tax=Eggerthella sinensis TaxID=242230 RepID=UPI0022E95199|nr:hypothetical protein [Eggerthella sinensis]
MSDGTNSHEETPEVCAVGAPMTTWQVWLRRLCLFVVVWAIAELLLGAALWGGYLFSRSVLGVEPSVLAEPVVGAWPWWGRASTWSSGCWASAARRTRARSRCSSGSRSSMPC